MPFHPSPRGVAFLLTLALAACGGDQPTPFGKIVEAESQANALLEANRLPEAAKAFERLVKLVPAEIPARTTLAIVYLRLNRPRDAEKQLREALARDSANVEARLVLASALVADVRFDDARRELTDRAARPGSDPRLSYALAEVARQQPDSAARQSATRDALTQAASRAPGNVPVRLELAQAFAATGQLDDAVRVLEEIEQLPPAMPADARPVVDQAFRALRRGAGDDAITALGKLHQLLELTLAFQTDLNKLRGPQITVAGLPALTLPQTEAMRRRLGRDSSLPDVTFVEPATQLPGLNSATGTAAALATGDYDRDDSPEFFVSAGDTTAARLIRWNGTSWTDVAASAGVRVTGATAAAFGDWDGDGYLDLFAADAQGRGYLFRNDGKGGFRDAAAAAGVDRPGRTGQAVWADLDHDGDLDLVLATDAGLRFFRNNGDGTLRDQAGPAGLGSAGPGRALAVGDLDDDGLQDLVYLRSSGAPAVFRNSRERTFTDVSAASGLRGNGTRVVALGDYDNDGRLDLLLDAALFRNQGGGAFALDSPATTGLRRHDAFGVRSAAFVDYDNDGFLDLVLGADDGLQLLHNEHGRFSDRTARMPAGPNGVASLVVADLDRDRDLDLVLVERRGLRWLRNDGGNDNLSIQIALTGLTTGSGKNNVDGIGARLEARVGDVYLMRQVSGRVTSIGLGKHLKADVIRVTWPNGVPQTLYFPGTDQDVVENQILKSSCGFLYAWNGTRFDFVTDVMWRSALGMPVGIGGNGSAAYAPAGPSEEYLKLPRGALVGKDGKLTLQLTEELWETSYTDQIRLVAVDHPDSVDAVTDERFVPPGAPVRLDLHHPRAARPPVSVVDDQGTDLLPALRDADDRFASDLRRERYQGVVRPHELIIDPGNDVSGRTLLLLRGWIFPTDASINMAMSQGHGGATQWPALDVKDAKGAWKTVVPNLSIPSGKNKLVVVDLTGKFAGADHRIRLRTNLEIYWDQVAIASDAPESPTVVTALDPASADLHFRGFSRMYRKGGRYGPHWFDYQTVATDSVWRRIDGNFTRFGDVRPLLESADDQYIVMAPGDETTLVFDPAGLPPLRSGWVRDYFLYSVGWIKDADLNTAHGGTVGPLPFHGIRHYPYAPGDRYPDDPAHRRYLETYNTRHMR